MTTDLISRIEAATEGSRELSDECLLAVGWQKHYPGMLRPDGHVIPLHELPDPSQNLQDAVDWMLPEGSEYEISTLYGVARVGVDLNTDSPCYGEHKGGDVALALCAASLRAIEARADSE